MEVILEYIQCYWIPFTLGFLICFIFNPKIKAWSNYE